jgi:hypothetical protein
MGAFKNISTLRLFHPLTVPTIAAPKRFVADMFCFSHHHLIDPKDASCIE